MLQTPFYWHTDNVTVSKSYDSTLNVILYTYQWVILVSMPSKFSHRAFDQHRDSGRNTIGPLHVEGVSSRLSESFVPSAGYGSDAFGQSFHKMQRNSHSVPQ